MIDVSITLTDEISPSLIQSFNLSSLSLDVQKIISDLKIFPSFKPYLDNSVLTNVQFKDGGYNLSFSHPELSAGGIIPQSHIAFTIDTTKNNVLIK